MTADGTMLDSLGLAECSIFKPRGSVIKSRVNMEEMDADTLTAGILSLFGVHAYLLCHGVVA
ncbi:hypothetical protein [Bradyrhizobium sp. CB3481]|uniref:hypothetical protein n=1 Tax=Bradyrhizobium sp. CB3481 TaxID=3039158 RepID=UPI0024B040C2|nr:hypothetical protein [Bradyrhizobium sp. CB3481]WFU14530.1 hypothetical protein QA643_25640 [Bradyrhizobium sp. CB3481]